MEEADIEDSCMKFDEYFPMEIGLSDSSSLGSDDQHKERPMTPPNNISFISNDIFDALASSQVCGDDRAPIPKKARTDTSPMTRHEPRSTSTPLINRERLSHTLPSTFIAPQLAHLIDNKKCKSADRPRPTHKKLKLGPNGIPYKYLNPFTPDGKILEDKFKARSKRMSMNIFPCKFRLNESSDSELQTAHGPTEETTKVETTILGTRNLETTDPELDGVPGRARLKEFNVSRFSEEFYQMQEIGRGVHGYVFRCLNRLNGCVYAIKRTILPIKTGIQERTIRNEVYAHGVLDHRNIVRNYSCWKEDGFIFIQNEYCNGGNLEDYIQTNSLTESVLRNLLLQMASALDYMHKKGLAHMDVKPGNIFLCIESNKDSSIDSDRGLSDCDKPDEISFKLGDLGHVTRLDEGDADEGDCRYLSREILQEKYDHLDKADIFSLGLTVYEAAGGGNLPKNGEEWQDIRNGNLTYLNSYSEEFNDLLKSMIHPNVEKRPSAAEVVELMKPNPISEEVLDYIQQYQRTNTRLEHTALATGQYLKELLKSHKQRQGKIKIKEKKGTPSKDKPSGSGKKKGSVTKTRVVGGKSKRSSSTTSF